MPRRPLPKISTSTDTRAALNDLALSDTAQVNKKLRKSGVSGYVRFGGDFLNDTDPLVVPTARKRLTNRSILLCPDAQRGVAEQRRRVIEREEKSKPS